MHQGRDMIMGNDAVNVRTGTADSSYNADNDVQQCLAYIASELNKLVVQCTALRLSLPCSSFQGSYSAD